MKSQFRSVFYLRSNYINKEGKTPVLIRIYLNKERLSLGSTGLAVNPIQWDSEKGKVKGHSVEALEVNRKIEEIRADILTIYKRLDVTVEDLTLERIKSEYFGTSDTLTSVMELFEKHNSDVRVQVGITKTVATLQKYENCKRHFEQFLKSKYKRTDLKFSELTPLIIHNFELFLLTVAKCRPNTSTKILKFLKTITIYGQKHGFLAHDPFANKRFHLENTDRGFLTDEEIKKLIHKEMASPRLDLVRDIFLFSCFTGFAYIDVANLTEDNIVELDGRKWIMTKRQKTNIATNILLLEIPGMILEKYRPVRKERKLLPVISNQKMNGYLKEVADLCGIKKHLTFHMARHTFATMSLSKGVPIESVSKMLGHTNIRTTQIYARITNKKIEADMIALGAKLDIFEREAKSVVGNRKLKEEMGIRSYSK